MTRENLMTTDHGENQVTVEEESQVNLKTEDEELKDRNETKQSNEPENSHQDKTEAKTVDGVKRSMLTDVLIVCLLKFFIIIGIVKVFKKSEKKG
jgi:hypothetical protein